MAVSCLAGSFNVTTGAVSSTQDVTGSITISGTSVVIFFFNGRTDSVDASGRATRWRGGGFAVSFSDQRGWCAQSVDANAAQDGGSWQDNTGCLVSVALESTLDGLVKFSSWLSNGFRLVVTDVMPRAYRIGYIIITGLTNAKTGQFQDGGTTGNRDITDVGFQGDCVLIANTGVDAAPSAGRNGASMLSFGFARSSSEQAVWSGGDDEGSASSDTDSYCIDGVEVIAQHVASFGSSIVARSAFVGWLSNGFTLNTLEVPATICYNFYLVLQGGSYKITSVQTRTDGNDIVTPALGLTPAGVIAISAFKAEHTQDTPTVHDTWSMGVASSASDRYAAALIDEDGLPDTEVTTAIEHDEIYIAINTSSAIEALMDVKSFDASTITFVMDDTEPTAAKFVPLLVIGNAGVTVSLQAAALTAGGQILDQQSGAVTKNLNAAALTAAGQIVDQQSGAVSLALQAVALAAQGQVIDQQSGAVTKNLLSAALSALGQVISIQAGGTPQTVNLTAAALVAGGQIVDQQSGPVSIALTAAALSALGQIVDQQSGAVSLTLAAAGLSALGQTITISIGGTPITVNLAAASLVGGGQVLTVQPGAVSKALGAAALAAAGQTLTAQPGGVSTTLSAATLIALGQVLDQQSGAVVINLAAGSLAAQGQAVAILGALIGLAVLRGLPRSFVLIGDPRELILVSLPRDFTLEGKGPQ